MRLLFKEEISSWITFIHGVIPATQHQVTPSAEQIKVFKIQNHSGEENAASATSNAQSIKLNLDCQ